MENTLNLEAMPTATDVMLFASTIAGICGARSRLATDLREAMHTGTPFQPQPPYEFGCHLDGVPIFVASASPCERNHRMRLSLMCGNPTVLEMLKVALVNEESDFEGQDMEVTGPDSFRCTIEGAGGGLAERYGAQFP